MLGGQNRTLPWHGEKEWMLCPTLELSLQGKETENSLDWDLSLAVLKQVDGKDIFQSSRPAIGSKRSAVR
jgi:hypothetical protein